MARFGWGSVGLLIGRAIGVIAAAEIAAAIYKKLSDPGLSTGIGDVIPAGSIGVINPKNHSQTIFVHPTKGGKVVDQHGKAVPGLGKTPPKVHSVPGHAHGASVRAHTAAVTATAASVRPSAHTASTSSRRFSLNELAALWVQAGGPSGVAMLMAHVAIAESGGDPTIDSGGGHLSPQGGISVAAGLWQILGLPFQGDVYDPLTNARMAVAKYRAGGLGPWVSSRGAWGQYVGKNEGVALTKTGAAAITGGASAPAAIAAPKDTTTAFDLATAQYGEASAAAALTPGVGDDNAARARYRRQVQAQLRRINAALRRKTLSRGARVSLLNQAAQLYGQLPDLKALKGAKGGENSHVGGAVGAFGGAQDKRMQGIQAALDTIDLHAQAGDITDDQATQQKVAVIEGALHPFNSQLALTPADQLQLRATEHQLQQSTQSQTDPAAQAQADLAAAVQANTDALNGVKDELKTQNDFAASIANVTSREAVRALADVISGQITGIGFAGRQLTAGAGSLARY